MSYFEAAKELKKKQFFPTYLLLGTEAYLLQDMQRKIIKYTLTDEEAEMNLSIYDLEETPIQEVVMDAETFPFFGERKVLICKSPVFLKAKPDKVAVEHDIKVLQDYLEHPVDYSIIVFIADYEKIDERKKIVKQIKNSGRFVSCESPKERDMSNWIKTVADELKVTIDPKAEDLFIQETGTNLMSLRSEIEKMALYIGENQVITHEVAELLISHQPQASALKMVDAVINEDLKKALTIYKDLEKQNEEPIALLALLASQFRLILQVKLLRPKGYSQAQMAQQLKVHPFAVKMALQRERNFELRHLHSIIHLLTEADANMKQGQMEKGLAFEMLLFHLITIKNEPEIKSKTSY